MLNNEDITMTQNATISAFSGGSFSAYLAIPSTQPSAGIVLIQEILGVNISARSHVGVFETAFRQWCQSLNCSTA
jgi:hypothetical protein